MPSKFSTIILLALTIAFPSFVNANPSQQPISLAAILSSGCVLQRDQPVKIWGTAQPGTTLTVKVKKQTVEAVADQAGKWLATLNPEPAGGPFTLTVSSPGASSVKLSDVYFGDVWLLAGQSNMFQMLRGQVRAYEKFYPNTPNKQDDFDDIRFAILETVESETAVTDAKMSPAWTRWQAESLGTMSTVGYFFTRSLRETLKANGMGHIPIGIIKACRGSTAAEQWISPEALATMTPPIITEGRKGILSGYYRGMLKPIQNYAIKGALWYQGENNSNPYARIHQYPQVMRTLIESWRKEWGINFPFYFVQLAAHRDFSPVPADDDVAGKNLNWAWVREAQSKCLEIPGTRMACIVDTGSQKQIHPPHKDIVGQRLARIALADTYGLNIVSRGPTVSDISIQGSSVIITFGNVAKGLKTQAVDSIPDEDEIKDGKPPVSVSVDELAGFALCGADQKFFWARQAEIISPNQVRISNAKDVPAPVAVRYAWQSFPRCNLFNSEGLPAEPFRTDTYEIESSTGGALSPLP